MSPLYYIYARLPDGCYFFAQKKPCVDDTQSKTQSLTHSNDTKLDGAKEWPNSLYKGNNPVQYKLILYQYEHICQRKHITEFAFFICWLIVKLLMA